MLRIAILGGGPRGLAAAEALANHAGGRAVHVTVFEPHAAPGAGPNYAPGQTPLNLLNIPLRDIDLPAPDGGEAVDRWIERQGIALGENDYPSRAMLGRYLADRFAALAQGAGPSFGFDLSRMRVSACRRIAGGWLVSDDAGHDAGPFDVALLCLGHQPVGDGQVDRWKKHAGASGCVLAQAYPSDALLDATDWQGRTVGIRGFGLAMIDVTRNLTEGLGGCFVENQRGGMAYRRSGREPARLVPFSLNGMPSAPKPASGVLDEAYRVTNDERASFGAAVMRAIGDEDGRLDAVIDVIASIAGRVLGGDGQGRVRAWLRDGAENDPGVPDDERPAQAMARYLSMAQGHVGPSVGYATGQVWRHLQNDLRKAYNPHGKTVKSAVALVAFDDGMKRFSYGPPAEATRRMLALIEAGILTLRQVDDPDVECVANGWRIAEGDDTDTASVMVDSVLAGPVLDKVTTPLVVSLREEGLVAAVAEKLGARVSPDGQAIDAGGRPVAGLFILGRLSIGSVIATDSLHDCFGAAVGRFAAHVLGGD